MKYAIVTGALGGIGLATIKELVFNDYNVIGIDNIVGGHNEYLTDYYQLDLSRNDLIFEYEKILDKYKPTVIVHLAAYQPIGEIDVVNEWEKTMNINVRSIVELVECAKFELTSRNGCVVIVSSIHAFCSSKDIALYAISKNALTGVIRNLAIDNNFRVNGIAPGAVRTPMLMKGLARNLQRNNLDDTECEELLELEYKKFAKRVKILEPKEIATVIKFLISPDSSGITGQTIIVDGGASIKLSSEN